MPGIGNVKTITKREWQSYFNSPVAYVFLIIFLALMGVFTFLVSRFYESGQADLARGFFFWHPWLYLMLVPAIAMRLWAEERRSGTIELLFTLPLTPAQAITGKFLAAWFFLVLALALTFPIVITVFYLGSPDLGVTICGYIGSAFLSAAFLAVGMWTSALTRNQVISFILAVVVSFLLIIIGFPPVTDFLIKLHTPVPIVDFIAAFSFITHFESMQRGILDVRDVLYFASMVVFFLFATHLALSKRLN